MNLSGNLLEQYGVVISGELAGTTTAVQLPNIECAIAYFVAHADNMGAVYLGGDSSVEAVSNTTNTVAGIQIDAGITTPWFPIGNLKTLYMICDNESDGLTYLVLRKE